MTVGERIRDRRKQLGFSAEYIASKLDCSPATVYRYENGYIEKVPTSTVATIADILDTTPAYLMGWEDINAEQLTDGELSDVKRSLIQFALSLTDEQAALALRVLRSIAVSR